MGHLVRLNPKRVRSQCESISANKRLISFEVKFKIKKRSNTEQVCPVVVALAEI